MTTLSTTPYEPGDVVLVRIVFTDHSGLKTRPAAVVSTAVYHARRGDVIVVPITSNRTNLMFADLALADWGQAGLVRPSVAKAVVQTVERSVIERFLGRLSDRDAGAVRATLRAILDLTERP